MAKEKPKKAAAAKKKPVKKKEPAKRPASVSETKLSQETVEAKAPVEAEAHTPQAMPKIEHKPSAAQAHSPSEKPKASPKRSAKPSLSYTATGRRKTAIARVTASPGSGKIMVNGKPLINYLCGRRVLDVLVRRPLIVVEAADKYDINARVSGGGIVGGAGAVSHGIARVLLLVNPDFRAKLRPLGYLTRDPRTKERKKYGRKKARKRFQYSKR